jgi:hypothetical protein
MPAFGSRANPLAPLAVSAAGLPLVSPVAPANDPPDAPISPATLLTQTDHQDEVSSVLALSKPLDGDIVEDRQLIFYPPITLPIRYSPYLFPSKTSFRCLVLRDGGFTGARIGSHFRRSVPPCRQARNLLLRENTGPSFWLKSGVAGLCLFKSRPA